MVQFMDYRPLRINGNSTLGELYLRHKSSS